MPAARNDPCPCGSGKKYKHCCLRQDEARRAALAVIPGASSAVAALHPGEAPPPPGFPWEADLVPLPATFDEPADARPAVLLAVAGRVTIHLDVVSSPPAEPAAIARLLAGVLATLGNRWGLPPAIHVRHRAVADDLRHDPCLVRAKIVARRTLPGVDRAVKLLFEFLGVPREAPTSSMATTWRSWRLGDELTATLFRAAAAYYRAAPWRHVANEQYILAELPHGGSWTAVVMGNGGSEFGLVLYSSPADLARQLDAADQRRALAALRQPSVALVFSDRAELPPPMRKEILAAGWEVAAPRAYPTLILNNTPGGGITRSQAEDLCALLAVVPRFIEANRAVLATRRPPARPLSWHDEATGIVMHYDGGFLDPGPPLWPVPEVLAPALPTGPAAHPEEALIEQSQSDVEQRHAELLREFERQLRKGRRATAAVRRDAAHVERFLEFLAGYQGIPVTACTEFDLRIYLYDWFPRKVRSTRAEGRALPVALARFFEFLHERGVACPWARTVLGNHDTRRSDSPRAEGSTERS